MKNRLYEYVVIIRNLCYFVKIKFQNSKIQITYKQPTQPSLLTN